MNELDMRNLVHRSIDGHCTGLRPEPYRVQKVLSAARKQQESKRRDHRAMAAVLCVLAMVVGASLWNIWPRMGAGYQPMAQPITVLPVRRITEEEAIEKGRAAIIAEYGLTEDDLSRSKTSAQRYITLEGERWLVSLVCYDPAYFQKPEQDMVVNGTYAVVLDVWGNLVGQPRARTLEQPVAPEGDILAWAKARYAAYAADARLASDTATDEFWTWPYEVKAAYSTEVWPVMMTMEHGPDYIMSSTLHRYGLPGEENLSRDAALDIAWRTVAEISPMPAEDVQRFTTCMESFDVTDITAPLWKFIITPADASFDAQYLVHINALTGEVTRAEGFQREDPRSSTPLGYAERWYY